jgi:YD repeat-containing protein
MRRSNWSPELGCLLVSGALIGAAPASAQTVTYNYDALGRLIEVQRPDGSKTTYAYDAADNRTSVVSTAASPPPPPPPSPGSDSIVPWLSIILG